MTATAVQAHRRLTLTAARLCLLPSVRVHTALMELQLLLQRMVRMKALANAHVLPAFTAATVSSRKALLATSMIATTGLMEKTRIWEYVQTASVAVVKVNSTFSAPRASIGHGDQIKLIMESTHLQAPISLFKSRQLVAKEDATPLGMKETLANALWVVVGLGYGPGARAGTVIIQEASGRRQMLPNGARTDALEILMLSRGPQHCSGIPMGSNAFGIRT